MKTSMTSLDIKVWIAENGELLEGAYIDNVYIVKENTLLLKLRTCQAQHLYLILEAGRRISFVKGMEGVKTISSEHYSSIQTLWRSLVRDCRVEKVEQLDYERIVFIHIKCGSKTSKIVVELLPRGVIALVDEEGRIKLVTESRSMRDRVVKSGAEYKPPPLRTSAVLRDDMNFEDLSKLLKKGKDLVRGVVVGWGLPGELAEEVIARCGLDKHSEPRADLDELRCLVEKARELLLHTPSSPRPCIVFVEGKPVGVYPYEPVHIKGTIERFTSFNDALDAYFSQVTEEEVIKQRLSTLESEIAKLERSLEKLKENVIERRNELKRLSKLLKIIEENFIEFSNIVECVRQGVRKNWDYVKTCSGVVKVNPKKGKVRVRIKDVEVDIDVRKNAIELYGELRKKVKEIEKDIKRAEEEEQKLLRKVEDLKQTRVVEVERSRVLVRKKSEWFERFHWMITSDGYLVIGGRDASQNRAIIRRYVEPRDVVMHADIHGGSAVVIKTEGQNPTEASLKEAAVLAACYSKAWKAGLGSVDVYWVYGSQVSLSPPSGEYIPRGGFMVYGKRNWIRSVRLELAIGFEKTEWCVRIVVGLPEALEKKLEDKVLGYFVLIPGGEDPSKIAKKILEKFANRFPELIHCWKAVSIDDILVRIPGRSKIKQVKFAKNVGE